jgi:hypothetical protein
MADQDYGVYWSIKTMDGHLFSSFRATVAEVVDDIQVAFGEDFAKSSLQRIRLAGTPTQVGFKPPSSLPVAEQLKMEFNATPAEETATSTESFESCKKCGSLKDRWVPPGTSQKTGKKYSGFWGCSNPACR